MKTLHPNQSKLGVMILLLLLVSDAWAEKIGFVDMDSLINNSPQIQNARRDIELEFEQQYTEIKQKESDLEILETRITKDGPIMSANELGQLQDRARILDRQTRRAKEDLKDAIAIRNSQILNDIQKDLRVTVEKYAKENNYDAILINAILYVSDEINITDEILKLLREQNTSKQ